VRFYVRRSEAGDEDAWRWNNEAAFRSVTRADINDEMVDRAIRTLYGRTASSATPKWWENERYAARKMIESAIIATSSQGSES